MTDPVSHLRAAALLGRMFVGGEWQTGEMALPHEGRGELLPTAIFARWRG